MDSEDDKFLSENEAVLEVGLHDVFKRLIIGTHGAEEQVVPLPIRPHSESGEHVWVVFDISPVIIKSL